MNLEKIKKDKSIKELIDFSILNVDKPSDWTSFDVVNYIRRLFCSYGFKVDKAGHFGTLDPMVTGVLPICLGKACKIQEYFMHRDKIYVGKMKIHKDISKNKLEEGMKKFLGKINQLPPRKSRVKRVVREREVKIFELINFNSESGEAEFTCEVQAGTYIRKLISDLGESLGIGMQMTALRRERAGLFSDKDKEFASIEKIKEALEEYKTKNKEEKLRELLVPAEIVVEIIPFVKVKPESVGKLKNGSPLFKEMLVDFKKDIKLIESKENFAVVCESENGNHLIEIAKFSDKFENKEIIAKPEAVIN